MQTAVFERRILCGRPIPSYFFAVRIGLMLALAATSWAQEKEAVSLMPSDWMIRPVQPVELAAVRDRLLEEVGGFEEADWANWPIRGRVATQVYRGTQADRKGVKAGDIFTHGGTVPLVWRGDLDRVKQIHPEQPVEYQLVRPGRKTYSITVEAGRIGFHHTPYVGRAGSYLRFGQRDPRWDRWMLAAIWADSEREVEWVPALLDAAVQAGYQPDRLSDAILLRNLLDQGRWDEAGRLAALNKVWSEDERLGAHPEDFFHAAQAAGRWDDMVRIVEAHPRWFGNSQPAQIRAWLKRLAKPQPEAGDLPTDVADRAGDRTLLNAELVAIEGAMHGDNPAWLDRGVRSGQPFLARHKPGHYTQSFLKRTRGIGNFDLQTRFNFLPSGESHMEWPNAITIGLVDLDQAEAWEDDVSEYWRGPHAVLMLRIENDGRWPAERSVVSLRSHGISSSNGVRSPWLVADGETPVDVRLVRSGGLGEIQINGRTVLMMPVDPAATNLGLHLHVVGYAVRFERFELTRFDELELPDGLIRGTPGENRPPLLAAAGVGQKAPTK